MSGQGTVNGSREQCLGNTCGGMGSCAAGPCGVCEAAPHPGNGVLTRGERHVTLVLMNAACGRSASDTILALMKAYRNPYSDIGASTLAA